MRRTITRADIWALFMALSKLTGLAEIYSDNSGVVQALNEGEVDCISANHKDADLWIQVRDTFHWHKEQNLGFGVDSQR